MPTVGQPEDQIEAVERFRVRVLHLHGTDVRGDRAGMPRYGYRHALRGSATVRDWIDGRSKPNFTGWDVEVLDARGKAKHGATLLTNVRASYQ